MGVGGRLVVMVLVVLTALWRPAWADDEVSRNHPVFQRWPELRKAYFEAGQTATAQHKAVAVPLPKQCAYFYADVYSTAQMSERDTRERALRECREMQQKLGSTADNFNTACECRLLIANDKYRVPLDERPERAISPVSVFYKDSRGELVRLAGYLDTAADARRRDGPLQFAVHNPGGQQICTGTLTETGGKDSGFTLSCLGGRFAASGKGYLETKAGPWTHQVLRGQTPQGLPVVVVIDLPGQIAFDRYGKL